MRQQWQFLFRYSFSLLTLVACEKEEDLPLVETEVMALKSSAGRWVTGEVDVQQEISYRRINFDYLSGSKYSGIATGLYKIIIYRVFAKIELPVGASSIRVSSAFEGYTLPRGTTRGFSISYTVEKGKDYAEMYYYVLSVDTDITGRTVGKYYPGMNYQPFEWAYYLTEDITPAPF